MLGSDIYAGIQSYGSALDVQRNMHYVRHTMRSFTPPLTTPQVQEVASGLLGVLKTPQGDPVPWPPYGRLQPTPFPYDVFQYALEW
ncbi:MAG: hypothetical protein ACKPKO_58710, partial [Candidatus Fonsibacter sp.]